MPYQVPPTSAPEAAPVVYDNAMIAQALDFAANRYGVDKAQIAEFASALPDMGDPIRNIMMAGNNLKKGNTKMVTPDNTAALDPKKNAYGANATRTAGDVAYDSFKSVAQAGVSLTGLLAGAAATVGVPNADKVVDATNYARDAIGKTKSLKAQADQAILSQAAEGKNEDGSDKGFLENAADTAAVLLDKPYMILDLGLQNSATLIAGAALGLGGAGTTALVGFQAALGAGDGYSSARERVMAMPTNELAQNSKAYNAFVAGGMTPEQAKLAVADSTAKAAGQTMGVVSGLIGKFGGVALEKSLGTVAAGGAVTGKMAAANAAKEIVTEGIEEGSNQLVGNTSIKTFANENQGFMQGVGGAATMGAAAAAPTSGAMAGGTYIASDRQAKINAEIEKARGKAVDVVTKADAALAMPSVGAASQAIDEAIKVKTANELANADTELQAALGTIEMYDAKSGEFLGATSNEATAVQPQAPATEAVEQLIPSPQDTAYGRLEQKRIDANNMMRGITPAVPEVEIEAAYRQAEQLREQQKQAELVELELQSLEAEREQLLKLQGETPVTNTAMAERLRSQLMNNEIKRLLIIDERKKAQETNPRLVEAGIEEMQGVETPELPMPITEDLATAPIALPENFADERLADTAYRAVLGDVMDQSMKGGGVQLIAQQGTGYTGGDGNEYGQQVTRTKSMNHPITQALIADGYQAEEVRNALDAALKGQKLGKRWQGLVSKALDYSNADAADIKAQMSEFEQQQAADIAPETLGYGDAMNAPFAPDNAQPVTMREQAMPRGAEGGVKFSVGGNTNGDELMALFMQSVNDALSGNKSEAQIKQDQQKALRDGLPVKIDSYIERQKSMLADWGSREYKQNNSRIEFTGDTPMKAESMSIGQINESRKRKTIQSLQENIAAAAKLKDGLSYLNLQGAVEEYYRQAGEVIKANPNEADYGGIDGYVERMISQRVLGQKKGEYGSNSLAAVIREAYKPTVDGNGVKFSVGSSKDLDAKYMAAVEAGDMETAQRMVNEYAESRGYVNNAEDTRMMHKAPTNDGYNASLDDVSGMFGDDIYSGNAFRYFDDGTRGARESISILQRVRNKPDATVKAYRAVPKDLKAVKLRVGDWVTFSRDYAVDHGEGALNGDYKIIMEPVKVAHLFTDGNSVSELGFDDGNSYAYQDTKNSRKLLDAVTYDQDGNIIPLSKRFNKRDSDPRYSFAGQKAKTANLENLATAEQMLADGVDTDTVWKQTGWEKGTDGQWKFEIDDSGAMLARNYVSIVRNKGYAPLSKVLKHESLFAAYPALNDVKVSLVARGNKLGSYSSERNVIDINLGLSKQEYLSTLLHEIQHAIQQEENFARGGSSSVITPEQREAALIELEHEAANMGLPSYESKVKDFLTGKITQEEYEDYLWDIASATKENGMAGYKFELYQRLAGETEARNTQARLTLGAEARRNTPPRMTEDVARDKQIVRFDGGRAEMAVDSSEISADKNDWRAVRKEVLDKVRERYQGKPEVFKTKNGDSVIVTWSGLKHALNHGVPTWQDSVIALHINELISNAELDSVAPDKNGRSNPHSAGVYYSNVVIDGVKYRAVMHTRIGSEGEKHYDHTVLVRESQAGQRGGVTEESALTTLPLGLANENTTTPKSEVNSLKQELAKSSDAKRLMNSGKVEVVQSIDDLPAEISEQVKRSVIAWHGSPNDFDQFSNNFIGDGTGEQVHGYGTYYSASKDEAARYKEFVENGKLYKVKIKPDQETFLTQKLLLSEHPEQMQEAIKGIKYVIESLAGGETVDAFTGGELYNNLSYALGSDKKASEFMRSMGIRGIKYTNGRSLNYVVFDDTDVEIVAKFSQDGKVQGLFDPASNKTYLIADNLSTADAMGVLTHEVGVHAWFNTANSEKKAALEKRAVGLLKTRKLAGGELRTFLDSVNERLIDAGHVDSKGNITDNEEAVAYIVEQAINQFADNR
jgi:hypothetical protein